MESGFKNVELDLKNLDAIMKKKNAIDKRNKILYGGKGLFPSQDKLNSLGNLGKFPAKKTVNFKE